MLLRYALSGLIFAVAYLAVRGLIGGGSFGAVTLTGPLDPALLLPILACITSAAVVGWVAERRRRRALRRQQPAR